MIPLVATVNDRLPLFHYTNTTKTSVDIQEKIKAYLESHSDPKRTDMEVLHQRMLQWLPNGKLWFLDGKDEAGKIVANPQIGYGAQTIRYADGKTREFYQVGISANTTGISVYIMGLNDKKHLPDTYGKAIGKASVTGYCIKFRKLADIDLDTLEAAIRDGIEQTSLCAMTNETHHNGETNE
jgi:hypothetical protein